MKSFVLVFLFAITFNAFAKEEILATVTNSENKDIYYIIAQSDDLNGDIKAFYKDTLSTGQKSRNRLETNTLQSRNGLVLEQRGEHKVIALKSINFESVSGGIITIDTLFNGANGERHNYEVQLAKDKSGWKLFKSGKSISKLHIEVNKVLFLGTVGVKNIRME
jgi:hypothetical protein